MRYINLLFLFVTGFGMALAQPRFVPDSEIMKLGEIGFQQPKTVVFGFANKGNKALQITSLKPSCGCLSVTYPTSPVAAGERGEITAVYDAKLLGSFYRDIEIFTNASDEPVYLAMQGTVVTDVQDYSEDFPIDLGNVRLKSNYVEFDEVNKGDHPSFDLQIVNTERTAYRPELMHLPPYLSAQYLPENIPAGKTGIIRLTLDSEKLNQMGLNQTSVYLARYMGDKVNEANEIAVSAVLIPDFSKLSKAELENGPELYVTEPTLNLGAMNGKEKVSGSVLLINMGKRDLHFKQVQVFNRAIGVSLGNRVLKPGKSTKLKVTVFAKNLKKAKSRPRVLLICDDPQHAKAIINIDVKP